MTEGAGALLNARLIADQKMRLISLEISRDNDLDGGTDSLPYAVVLGGLFAVILAVHCISVDRANKLAKL